MRRLLLIRHGETEGGSSVRFFGRTDVPLAESGLEQARRLAGLLSGWEAGRGGPLGGAPAAVFHSPLARARETAEILASGLVLPAAVPFLEEEDLREVDFGELEGLTMDEVRKRFPELARRWERGDLEGFPGGDEIAAFRRRAAAGVERCLARAEQWCAEGEGAVAVVAHRGVCLAALGHLVPGLPGPLRRFATDLGSVSCLVRREGKWEVALWNAVPGPA